MRIRLLALPAVSALALVATGCGTKTIKQSSENDLATKAAVAVSHGTPPKSVSCPSGVEAKAGKTFECTATLASGTKAIFSIRIDSVSGDTGHMTVIGARKG